MFRFLALISILACGVLSFLSWAMPYLVGVWYSGTPSFRSSFGNFQSTCTGDLCSNPMFYESRKLSDWKDADDDVYNGLCANIAMTLIGFILLVATLFLLFKKSGITHLVFVTGGIFVFIGIMAFVGKFQNSDTHDGLKTLHDLDSDFHWSYSASTAFSIIVFIVALPGAFFALKAKDD
ncbi:epithelial membrane protein-related [Anaeramoeba ignava]|uniref:Epithelial membrane protein-related n=1 Tax=Anaeramoeba ignava TaxID=1746090 RepID=A0A9Q0L7W2_ANAIG|nr:epithelial membrane protein-related [Anaeramoeba ignava]